MAIGKRIGEPVKRESECHVCGATIECEGKDSGYGSDICEECDAKQRSRQPRTYPPILPQPIPIIDKEWPRHPWERPRPVWGVAGDRTIPMADVPLVSGSDLPSGVPTNPVSYLGNICSSDQTPVSVLASRMACDLGVGVSKANDLCRADR